jgi:hypothetical protein
LKCLLEFHVEHRILLGLFERNPRADENRRQKLQILLEILEAIIENGMAKREFKKSDPLNTASYILSLIIGYNHIFAKAGNLDSDQESRSIAEFIKACLVRSGQ